ncbi:hypothetical protein [Humibacter ginsenosidimutans]|nr:hypothetical protein [Humibacter ginsenosidimutans]
MYHWKHGWIPLDHEALKSKFPHAKKESLDRFAEKFGIGAHPSAVEHG